MTYQLSLTSKQLLQEIAQLDTSELEGVAYAVSLLRARRIAPSLSKTESDLVRQISACALVPKDKAMLLQLGEKMEAQDISDTERQVLLELTDRSEQLNVQRMRLIGELATVRGETVLDTMSHFGLLNADV